MNLRPFLFVNFLLAKKNYSEYIINYIGYASFPALPCSSHITIKSLLLMDVVILVLSYQGYFCSTTFNTFSVGQFVSPSLTDSSYS